MKLPVVLHYLGLVTPVTVKLTDCLETLVSGKVRLLIEELKEIMEDNTEEEANFKV